MTLGAEVSMWSLFVRVGMMLSTAIVGKQFVDHFWPTEIHPTRLYRPHQIARYLGTTTREVLALVEAGSIAARWMGGEPRILGVSVLEFLTRRS